MSKPALLYYCQPGRGMGGMVRAITIAGHLTNRFQVSILSSGVVPSGIKVPVGVEIVQLPPLRLDIDGNNVITHVSPTLAVDIAQRRKIILERYKQLKPRVLLFEQYPFGSRALDDELMPLIESTHDNISTRPIMLCSVTDILLGTRQELEKQDDDTASFLEKYFHAVLVHSDPAFARLGEFFQPRNTLAIPVYRTGFVARKRSNPVGPSQREKRVVVSAGGGRFGGPLYRAAIEAHRLLWQIARLPMTIITGSEFMEAQWQRLNELARDLPGITLVRSVPDIGAEFGKVRWAVCHCSYNMAVDVTSSGVGALLVPVGNGHESRRIERARRLVRWGAGQLLMPHHLNGASLANCVQQLIKFKPQATTSNLDGAEVSANLTYHFSLDDDVRSAGYPSGDLTDRPHLH